MLVRRLETTFKVCVNTREDMTGFYTVRNTPSSLVIITVTVWTNIDCLLTASLNSCRAGDSCSKVSLIQREAGGRYWVTVGGGVTQARDDKWELRVGGRDLIRPRCPFQGHGDVIITERWRLESGTTGPGPGEGWGFVRRFWKKLQVFTADFLGRKPEHQL